jgi:predicted DCC family thiol-disulfide oxidoreductase YuxK
MRAVLRRRQPVDAPDVGAKVNFTSMQRPLGQALYRDYRVDADESYLLIANGRAFTASRGYLELCANRGGSWHLVRALVR